MLAQSLGLSLGVPFLLFFGVPKSVPLLLPALLGVGLSRGIYDSNIWASLYDTVPIRSRGFSAGMMNSFGWVGGGLGPLYVAYVSRVANMSTALSSTGVLILLLAVAMLMLSRSFNNQRRSILIPK